MTEQNQETARLQERLKPTSRTNPRPPSPIRSLSQNPLGSRATSTATTAVNATGSSVFFSSDDRTAKASLEVDASPLGRFKPQHQQSLSAGPRSHTKVVMLTVSQPNMPPPVRRSTSHRPPCTSSDAPAGPSRSPEGNDKEKQRIKAAAKLAEKENWEKTRGAGSAVMDLLKSPEEQDSDSSDTSGERSARPQIRKGDSSDSSTSSHSKRRDRRQEWEATQVLPSLEEVQVRRYEPTIVTSADKLLSRGISEYTLLPRILGRGKFSSVFLASKPSGPNGAPQLFAVKHTPLFPHHPLIATRLLREPTLLAELPPHPNLVTVHETIRTPGHFYLVEEYLGGYVTLEALLPMRSERSPPQPPCLPTDVAKCILDQLLSAVHAIHHPLQICHRDIKPENILVHPDTLELKLLDFGLATHFSKSEPKLTTCCGSPAFHCPEIVTALRNPQGAVRYWGPEVDVWTCGITMLRVLTGIRYPIGASHSNVRSMSIRAQRAVGTIPDPELRERVGKLLQVNGERRMRNFEELVETIERQHTETQRGRKEFKSTTFIPTRPQHTMHLPLVVGPAAEAALSGTRSRRSTSASSKPTSPAPPTLTMESPSPSLILSNPLSQPPQRVLSFIKYCLRCAGILYHCWPDSYLPSSSPSTPGPWEAQLTDMHAMALSGMTDSIPPPSLSPTTTLPDRSPSDPYYHIQILECVLEIIDESDASDGTPPSLVQTLMNAFSFGKRPPNRRSLSTPPKPEPLAAERPASGSGGPSGQVTCLTFYMVIRFPKKAGRPGSSSLAGDVAHSRSRASSRAALERDVSIESFPRQPIIDSNSTTPRASRTSNPSIATKELTIETSPDMLGPTVSASAPASRATSRTRNRKESRARAMSNTFRKSIGNRVLVHITDERALEAVKKALSVGGTTVDPEEGPKEESTKRPGLKHRPLSYGGETKQQSVESRGRQQRAEWMALQAILPISSGSNDDAEYISRGRPLGISKARGKSQLSSVQEPQLQLSSDPQTLANKIMEMYNKDRQALTVQLDAINFEAFKILFPDFEQALMILAELTSARETYMSIDLVLPSITCGHELVMIIKMLRVVVPRITTKTPGNFTSVFEVLPCIISRVGQGDGERVFEACCMLVKRVVEWTTRTKETVEHFLKAVMAAAEFVTPRLYSAFLPGSILELKGEGSWKLVETTLSELGITLSSSDPLSFAVHVYIEAFSTRSIGAGMEMAQLAMQQQLALAADEKLSQTEPYLATPSFTALLWGLQEEKVKDVVAVCSAHAPICPDPQGRKARLDILKYLLRTRTEETVAPLKEVVKSSPFSQMQATALGLLRSVFDHVPLQVWEEVLDVKGGEDLKVEQCSLLILLLAKKGEVKRAEQFIEQLKEEEGILALQVERVREAIERKR